MFKSTSNRKSLAASIVVTTFVIGGAVDAWAHCDTLSGPVITAARKALETGNVNLVLIWVQPGDDAAIRETFTQARAARAAGGSAQASAEQRFFEDLVRIHRAGEGAPYTGIKPEGTEVGPAVKAADEALATGTVEPVRAALLDAVRSGIETQFNAVAALKSFDPDEVAAGRAFVKAYVQYTHFAEGLHDKAVGRASHEEHAHEGSRAVSHEEHAQETPRAAHLTGGLAEHGEDTGDHGGHAGHLPWILVAALGLAVVVEAGWIATRRQKSAPRA